MKGKRRWISILAAAVLLVPLIATPMNAMGSEADDQLGAMIKQIRVEYQEDDMNQYMAYFDLKSIGDRLPERSVVLEDESEESGVAQALYQEPSIGQTVTDALYQDPNNPTVSGNGYPLLPEGEPVSFHEVFDELIAAYQQQVEEDAVLDDRFVGTRFSRTKLDLYRLLHSYYTTYQLELTDQEHQMLLSGMAMLLVVELKQAEAIKGDMNSFMTYLKQKGGRIKPPSEAQQDVANRHWELAMEHLEKGIAVSSFVQLHNSLRESHRVMELNEVEYSQNHLAVDSDVDNVPDLMEYQNNTDAEKPDTDGDGLSDWFEIANELAPLQADEDVDGVSDRLEDIDADGLTNEQEQQWATHPKESDTDQDHLSDAEEVLTYHTDPNKADTDGDSLIDSKDVELGLNPLAVDTDGDGMSDAEMSVTETVPLPEPFAEKFEEAGAVPEVVVEGQPGAGELAVIGDAAEVDAMMPGIVGLVGHPIDITTSGKFDKATIKFRLTEQAGLVPLDRLRVMWWDEQNKQMVMLPNQQVEEATRTVSAETTHFSRYALIDIDAWQRVWNEGYIPGKPTVLRGKIERFAVATSYSYREGTLYNSGVVERAALDQSLAQGSVNTDLVQAQSFTYGEANSSFISNAVDRLIQDASLHDKWKILLVASETKKVNDPALQAAIEKAKSNQIKIFVYWTSNEQGSGSYDLEKVAHDTDGNFYQNDLQTISYSMQMWQDIERAVLEEEDVDRDGIPDRVERKGILFGTGERIFPSTATEDLNQDGKPDGQDTDGDGLIDGYEMGYVDREGNAYEKPMTDPVASPGDSTARKEIIANYQGCSFDECETSVFRDTKQATRANNYSVPKDKDSDSDGYNDKEDRHPMDFYKQPVVMLHGILSNGYNVYGAPNDIANGYENKNLIYTDAMFELKKSMLTNVDNQRVHGSNVTEDGLYHYLEKWGVDEKGHHLYVSGNNMFVFNYANVTRFDKNSYVLRDYLENLWYAKEIESPTWDEEKPKIDIVVHSMGGLVTRYYNEQLTYHAFDINRVVFLATPHLGGRFVDWLKGVPRILVDVPLDLFASAAKSLSKQDRTLNDMNWESMEYQTTWGVGYYAIGGVKLGKDQTSMPDWLRQNGPSSTTYEYWADTIDNYETQAANLIGYGSTWAVNDGSVDLNSAMGTVPPTLFSQSRHIPFASRWVYIGLYDYVEHTHIHHDSKAMWKTNEILVGGR